MRGGGGRNKNKNKHAHLLHVLLCRTTRTSKAVNFALKAVDFALKGIGALLFLSVSRDLFSQ